MHLKIFTLLFFRILFGCLFLHSELQFWQISHLTVSLKTKLLVGVFFHKTFFKVCYNDGFFSFLRKMNSKIHFGKDANLVLAKLSKPQHAV